LGQECGKGKMNSIIGRVTQTNFRKGTDKKKKGKRILRGGQVKGEINSESLFS